LAAGYRVSLGHQPWVVDAQTPWNLILVSYNRR